MRALLLPQSAARSIATESDSANYTRLIEKVAEPEPSYFYVWARVKDEGVSLPAHSALFAEQMRLLFHQQMAASTGRLFGLFNRQNGDYPVDVVFTSRAGLVPALSLGLATTAMRGAPISSHHHAAKP